MQLTKLQNTNGKTIVEQFYIDSGYVIMQVFSDGDYLLIDGTHNDGCDPEPQVLLPGNVPDRIQSQVGVHLKKALEKFRNASEKGKAKYKIGDKVQFPDGEVRECTEAGSTTPDRETATLKESVEWAAKVNAKWAKPEELHYLDNIGAKPLTKDEIRNFDDKGPWEGRVYREEGDDYVFWWWVREVRGDQLMVTDYRHVCNPKKRIGCFPYVVI